MNLGHYQNHRDLLRDELQDRTRKNPQYSLRAFARDLEISPQALSLAIHGKKNISTETTVKIAKKLNFTTEETSYFCDLVSFGQTKSESVKEMIRYRLGLYKTNEPFELLQEDILSSISDWYHYAILELTFTTELQNDPTFVAKRLNISVSDAREAIDRLLRLKMLKDDQGRLVKTKVNTTTTQDVPSEAIKNLNKQLLEKALMAIDSQDLDSREFGSMTMAIDPLRIPQAKKILRKFRRQLATVLEAGDRTEIFTLTMELFKISN
jgi:uncharacterized protein (TIGR02147 family)